MRLEKAPEAVRWKGMKRRWRRAVIPLSCCVAALTAYALMRPATTMTPELLCGLEPHTHDAGCYAQPDALSCPFPLHTHTEDCLDPETGEPRCGYADFVIHTHDAACYGADGTLICLLPEKEEHTHGEECYAEIPTYSCGQEACEAHMHSESCYETQSVLTCTDEAEDHEHTEDCYTEQPVLICCLDETEGHIHTVDCLGEPERQLICTKEELRFHEHSSECFDPETGALICAETQLLRHQHDASCGAEPVLICGLEEHEHTESCYETQPEYDLGDTYYCGLGEHVHTEACYADDGTLACSLPEHLHTEACLDPDSAQTPPEEEGPEPDGSEEDAADWESLSESEKLKHLAQLLGLETPDALQALAEEYELSERDLDDLYEAILAGEIGSIDDLREILGETKDIETLELPASELGSETLTADFVDGAATVTFQDGTTLTMKFKSAPTDGSYKLAVTQSSYDDSPTRDEAAHGFTGISKMYSIAATRANGDPIWTEMQLYLSNSSGFITQEHPLLYQMNTDGTLSVIGAYGALTFNSDYTEISPPYSYSSVTSTYKLVIGYIEGVDDTFLDWPAEYSIGYILRNYNVFVQNDYTGTHVVGPVAVGGSTNTSLGGLSVGDKYGAPHLVPDYIGYTTGGLITANPDSSFYVYLGEEMMRQHNFAIESGAGQTNQRFWYAKQYVDFDAAMAQIQAQMDAYISQNSGSTVTSESGSFTRDANGKITEIPAGGLYRFKPGELADTVRLTGYSSDCIDTIIVMEGTNVKLPKLHHDRTADGEFGGHIESGMESGIVFACPDATGTVTGDQITGHIIAPYADVTLTGGFFNGCAIAKSLNAQAEGHMWPYNGRELRPTTGTINAWKLVNGTEPAAGDESTVFEFILEEYKDGTWTEVTRAKNETDDISFMLNYAAADVGEHIYRIRENTAYNSDGFDMDDRCFYAVAAVTAGTRIVTEVIYYDQDPTPKDFSGTPISSSHVIFRNDTVGGYELPETGGCGTGWMHVTGLMLAAGSLGVLGLRSRRRRERRAG